MDALTSAVELARFLGDPALDIAILAEGNVSAWADEETFWVKASGSEMAMIGADGFVRVRFKPILDALASGAAADDGQVKQLLKDAVQDGDGRRPSVETFMHGYLLSLPGVKAVGHGHPTSVLSLLAIEDAEGIARQRILADEIVWCGPAAAFVPYVDPGLLLARSIRTSVESYLGEYGILPRTIWMANHGLVALGETPAEVRNAFAMSVKAARIWLGALATGRPLKTLTEKEINRIHTRPDEHYRQALLRGKAARGSNDLGC